MSIVESPITNSDSNNNVYLSVPDSNYCPTRSYGLQAEYPVDRIIIKCMRIQKLIDRSSRAIKKFSQKIKTINTTINQLLEPTGLPPILSTVDIDMSYQLMGHRHIFDQILAHSDSSDVEEPDECNTSMRDYKAKRERKRAAERRRALRRQRTPAPEAVLAAQRVCAEPNKAQTV